MQQSDCLEWGSITPLVCALLIMRIGIARMIWIILIIGGSRIDKLKHNVAWSIGYKENMEGVLAHTDR